MQTVPLAAFSGQQLATNGEIGTEPSCLVGNAQLAEVLHSRRFHGVLQLLQDVPLPPT
jgi:hypothetical protein